MKLKETVKRIIKEEQTSIQNLSSMSLSEIAQLIYADYRKNKKPFDYAAAPYLEALATMQTISDNYGLDSGSSIVAYLLSNLQTWKGDVAREVKKELNRRLKFASR